jgi:hypothetical protein
LERGGGDECSAAISVKPSAVRKVSKGVCAFAYGQGYLRFLRI